MNEDKPFLNMQFNVLATLESERGAMILRLTITLPSLIQLAFQWEASGSHKTTLTVALRETNQGSEVKSVGISCVSGKEMAWR